MLVRKNYKPKLFVVVLVFLGLYSLIIFRLFILQIYHKDFFKILAQQQYVTEIALPTALAGWLLRIPIELHELNVIPGKAIRVLSPLAQTIFVTFEQSKRWFTKKNCTLEPYPLRFSLTSNVHTKESLIKTINSTIAASDDALRFIPTKKTLFLLGGSQGSLFLNNILKQWVQKEKKFHGNYSSYSSNRIDRPNRLEALLSSAQNTGTHLFISRIT